MTNLFNHTGLIDEEKFEQPEFMLKKDSGENFNPDENDIFDFEKKFKAEREKKEK